MTALIIIGLAFMTMASLGNASARKNMSADDHRREAQNLLQSTLNTRSRSRIETNYTQAMAHLQIADEMDYNNDRPTGTR